MDVTTLRTPPTPPHHTTTQTKQHNPYARMPSRRAIACVTCAKAKTKCNKALPSCSRCITKGIRCEPRSTRRTSENNHRSNIKKLSRPSMRHCSASGVSRLDSYIPSTSFPSSQGSGNSYAASYHDTEAIMKSRHQTLGLSGYPILSPLSPKDSQTINGAYAYIQSPEQELGVFAESMDTNSYLDLGAMSPQTPDPIYPYQPVSMVHDTDTCLYPQSWSDEILMPTEFGFDFSAEDIVPEMWATPDATAITPVARIPWDLLDFHDTYPCFPNQLGLHAPGFASLLQYQSGDTSGQVQSEWGYYEPAIADMNVASTPFIHDLYPVANRASTWSVPFPT